ncbi:MAG TPA: J domain-containing protein [Spirochaetota bacterium]|nr:J domain-containing protein [Spirochaetota bacterium]
MNIDQCYKLLRVESTASNEDISKSFKILALKYHPDKNPHNKEWANEQMTMLNTAYSDIMSYRFRNETVTDTANGKEYASAKPSQKRSGEKPQGQQSERVRRDEQEATRLREEETNDELAARFVRIRDDAKDAIYKYFQYGLYNFHRREDAKGEGLYKEIVLALRKSFHRIKRLAELSKDRELLEHFAVFSKMIFDFYRSTECLNIIDSYRDEYEVNAWRMYRKGDELLHQAHRELFFDRHNRGHFLSGKVFPDLNDSETIFRKTLNTYPDSSWAVETAIKLDYIKSLKAYINLFFTS